MRIDHCNDGADYAARRAGEYPPLAEQLDALWHAMNSGLLPKVPGFFEPIQVVKDRYSKPTEEAVA